MLILIEGGVLWLTVILSAALGDHLALSRAVDVAILYGRAFLFAAIIVIGLYIADLYDIAVLRHAAAFPQRFLRALGVSLCLFAVVYALFPSARLRAPILMPSGVAGIIFLFAVRAALSRIVRRGQPERVLVLGDGPFAARIVSTVRADVRGEHAIVGVLGLVGDGSARDGQLDDILSSARPDRIVVAVVDRNVPLPFQQLTEGRLHGIAVEDGVRFYERFAGRIVLERLTADSVAFGDGFSEARFHAAFARAVGVLVALIGLVATTPLLVLLGSAIRVSSRGPVFVVQQRVGRYGRPYGLIELRTMHVTGHAHSGRMHDDSDRITPIGRWLRRFRIDRLPQLVNVLKGDMNLVGPRPHPVSKYRSFMERIPHYAQRSRVRPGITGWAQVRYGDADKLDQEIQTMGFDLFYIRNVSVGLDLRIMLETLRLLFERRESAGAEAQHSIAVLLRTTTLH